MKRLLLVGALALAATWASGASAQMILRSGGTFDMRVVSYRDMPFRTVVRQEYDFSCGSAALATLLRHHYGLDVDEAQIFREMYASGDQAAIRRVGFSLLDMKRYLEGRGYSADGFRLTLEGLAEVRSPAIVLVNSRGYRHFAVFKGADGRHVLIGDPALGLKVYTNAEFSEMWDGVAFVVHEKTDAFNQVAEWDSWAQAPIQDVPPPASLANLTRELPPIYQISTTFSLDGFLR